MKLRKAIKKIVAIGATTLLGATMIASAADLSEYPAPFISGGKFSGMLVVGDKAAAEDVIGVSDIAMSLQYAATSGTSTGTSTSVEGDAWLAGTSSKKLEMTNQQGSTGNETIRDIQTSIDEDELTSLADGSITTEKGTAGYNQYINFDETAKNGGYVKFMENDDDVVGDFLYFKSGVQIARYSLEFKTSLKSDVEDSTGSKTSTGTYLGDLEDEKITILGKEYNIVKARRTNGNGNNPELTLMGGSVKDTLSEGETKTYLDGKYEVTVTAITDTGTIYAKFNVNGETTKSLKDGDSATLSDGTELGIADIIPNEAGDVTSDLVEFYLGASKVYLKDTAIQDTASSNALEVGSEKIDDAYVKITGSDDNATFSIDSLQINITADDDFFVAAGHSLTEYMEEPEAFLGLWDIKYEGLDNVETETYKIRTSGSDTYELQFVDGDGNLATVPIAYTSGTTVLARFGDNDNTLVLNGTQVIKKNDYLIVTDVSQDDGNRKTYALKYKGADKVASGETALVKFDNLGTGSRIEQSFTEAVGDTADATLKIGGSSFAVINATADTSDDFDVRVDLDADGTVTADTDVVAINTNAGLKIVLTNETTSVIVTLSTPNSNHYDNIVPAIASFNITASSGEVSFVEHTTDEITYVAPSEETNTKYAYTSMGAKYKWESPTNDPAQLTVEYPKEQRLPLVYITTAGAKVTKGTSASGVESVSLNKIEVGATKLASEITDVKAQNLILVGGPCANAAAAEAKSNPTDCAAGFEAGKGLIELVETGSGNVALIVAGYDAKDTRAATSILADYGNYALKGAKMEVVTATSTVKEVTATAATTEAATTETPAVVE
ncbi:MAG TPA: hypothetical protein VFF28_05700 [Candidatus Nanoarchaeia archaeon]|nr:hypothetical protein [Candidatus Nanoarchaeia archaeon]